MSKLIRTHSGGFSLENALQVDTMKVWEKEELLTHLIPLHKFLADRAAQEAEEF